MIWIITVVYSGELTLTEAYSNEEDAQLRADELNKTYFFVHMEEVEIQ